jgi:glycosyltransferase involved in cell wall biosynthesis
VAPLPKISIITVVLNRQHDIRFTLESVVQQNYHNIEYIVIDGGSTDGTLSIIQEYLGSITTLISEKDQGIYDAMNKGLSKASGEYVLFINGGDALHQSNVLSQIENQFFRKDIYPDILYGECMFVDSYRNKVGLRSEVRRNRLPKELNKMSFFYGSNVTHQCFIIKRKLASNYDIKYRLSSDLDWMLRGIERSKYCINTHLIIADFVLGDASQKHYWQSMKERFLIWCKHYGIINSIVAHIYIVFNSMFNKK